MRLNEFTAAASGLVKKILVGPRRIQIALPADLSADKNPLVNSCKNIVVVETARESGLWKAYIETRTDIFGCHAIPVPYIEKEEIISPRCAKDMIDALDMYFLDAEIDLRHSFTTNARRQIEACLPKVEATASLAIS